MERLSTLCYIEQDGKYLMLHRTVKKNDVNKDKWIGVGGHFEHGESPEECLLREVKEETGYTLTSWKYRGIVTFVYGEDTVEYMSLYTADGFTGEPIECDEGELEWVDKKDIPALELWEGDKIFFRLLDMEREFFSLKLVYNRSDVLQYAALCSMRSGRTAAGQAWSRSGAWCMKTVRFIRLYTHGSSDPMTKAGMICSFRNAASAKIPIPDAGISPRRDMWKPVTDILRAL